MCEVYVKFSRLQPLLVLKPAKKLNKCDPNGGS